MERELRAIGQENWRAEGEGRGNMEGGKLWELKI